MKFMNSLAETIKSIHLEDGHLVTWTNPGGNIIQPRVYRTFKGCSGNYFGNIYNDEFDGKRYGAQLGRLVFTTEPK